MLVWVTLRAICSGMSEFDELNRRPRSVPSGRVARLAGFGKMAGGIAGGVIAEGARRVATGERPSLDQMLLTPGNITRLADNLAHLRGAAMKLGQMISMDAGDVLPPELTDILAKLRDRADFMPARQLDKVLAQQWGSDWRKRFRRFEPRPIAAASIGQVHRALTRDGKMLAIKVQYPGVAQSIDSDVDNVATLLRVSGLLPKELDIAPLLKAAKEQLHEEADYLREGRMMQAYATMLAGRQGFIVPELYPEHSSAHVLAMSFEEGVAIESLSDEADPIRNSVFSRIIRLVADELFTFGTMQTDPNFANFRYNREEDAVVLLDFGATRAIAPDVQRAYRNLLRAGIDGDRDRVREEAVVAGFISPLAVDRHGERIDRAVDIIVGEMTAAKPLDFGDRSFVPEVRETVMPIARDKASWHIPPPETLFVQRKVSGTALLGAKLRAVVDVKAIVEEVLDRTDGREDTLA